jgi:glycerate kinase
MGKAPVGVAEIAKKYNKKVIAFAGCVTEDSTVCNAHGIDAYFPILRTVVTLDEAMNGENAKKNMIATVEQVFRLIKVCE